jgi:predicted transcriptional regulator
MPKFNIPDRRYCDGEKKLMSIRLPEKLLTELEALADRKGWNQTDIIATALDQYVQWEKKQKK